MSSDDPQSKSDETTSGMRQQVLHGVRWSAVARYGVQSIQLVTSLTLARLLAPENFGLMAMAMVFVEFSRTCLSLGFSSVIVQREKVDQQLLSSLFYFNCAVALLITLVLALISPLIGLFYGNQEVTYLLLVLSSCVVVASPSLVPAAMLNRELKFNRLAVVDISVGVVQSACAITMALSGFDVWSLVGGAVTGAVLRPLVLYRISSWRPSGRYVHARVREVARFGANLTGFDIMNFFSRNADNVIIGRFLGETPLGYYSVAYRILQYPREAVSSVIGRVLLPTFSRLQNDDERLAAAYIRVNAAIAFVTFPMMLGLTSVADSFVRAILDTKWLPALPIIYIFCPLGMLQSIGSTVGQLFVAKGKPGLMFRLGAARSVLIVASFVIGLPWGILGVAISYAAMIVVGWLPSLWLAFKLVPGLTIRRYFASLIPYAIYSGTMGAAVFGLQVYLKGQGLSSLVTLLICVPVGAVIYSAIVLILKPPAMHDFLAIVPNLRRGRPKSQSPEERSAARNDENALPAGQNGTPEPGQQDHATEPPTHTPLG